MQTKSIVRTFETFEDALDFYKRNQHLSVAQLEPVLSQLAFIQAGAKSKTGEVLFVDERFLQLLLQVTSDMARSDSASLTRYAQAVSKLSVPRGGSVELNELARKIAEVSVQRVNAFSPNALSQLAFGLGSRGVSDPQFVDFIRMESLKMIQDFSPESAIMMLEAFRRMGVFNRELADNLVERLTDEVDRFTSRDISNCVSVMVKLGLGRGYLLRRLSRLSFENLDLFTTPQLVKLFSGYAKLRFITTAGVEEMLSTIDSRGLDELSPSQAAELVFATAMSGYTGESHTATKLVDIVSETPEEISITNLVDATWALCLMDNQEALKPLVVRIFAIPPPSNRQLLLKTLEISNALKIEFPKAAGKDLVSAQWWSAMEDAEKMEVNRFESSRLHSEILALIESIKPSGPLSKKLAIQRAAQVGCYRCDFYDEAHKLIVDIDTLSRPTTLTLKHRHLAAQGFKVVSLGYWDVRRFKTLEEQQEWLRILIHKALRR